MNTVNTTTEKVPGMNVTFVNGMVIASWFGDFGGWDLDGYPEHDPEQLKVTHWMPLPDAPGEGGESDG